MLHPTARTGLYLWLGATVNPYRPRLLSSAIPPTAWMARHSSFNTFPMAVYSRADNTLFLNDVAPLPECVGQRDAC